MLKDVLSHYCIASKLHQFCWIGQIVELHQGGSTSNRASLSSLGIYVYFNNRFVCKILDTEEHKVSP